MLEDKLLERKMKLSSDYMLHKDENTHPVFFLFNINSGTMFKINETTSDFLSMCDGTKSISDIILMLAKDYKIDYECVKNDFLPLVKKWVDLNILS